MGITDRIEAFINELIRQQDDADDWLELGRNDLADIFGCVPSQINYVISTRFSPEKGYAVESRRGGGGYIKIRRIYDADSMNDIMMRIGNSISDEGARSMVKYLCEHGALDKKSGEIILAATCDASIPVAKPERDAVRAAILKNTLITVM